MDQVGKWVFIVGLVIAVIAGLGVSHAYVPMILAILGLVVGFLNVGGEESHTFLIAAIALVLSASALDAIPYVEQYGAPIVSNVIAFIGAAVLVVALKSLFTTARA